MSRARSSILFSRRAALLGLLGGCGFRPIYADGPAAPGGRGSVAAELAATRVALIPERIGQLLRSALNQRLRNGSAASAQTELRVAISLTRQGVGVRGDDTASRVRVSAVANYVLTALGGREPLVTGRAFAADAFNLMANEYFASQLSGEAADERLTERLADDIVAQLAAFYARRAATAS
jgi:LPS-assembly lipoprotein